MLPKILRIRRWLILPVEVLRGLSIALVAMCFPALREARTNAPPLEFPGVSRRMCGALSRSPSPMRAVRALIRTLSRRGREKPRAHESVRRSRLFVDEVHIILFFPL